jgi:hypothetical protein
MVKKSKNEVIMKANEKTPASYLKVGLVCLMRCET